MFGPGGGMATRMTGGGEGGYGCTHSELWHQDAGRWTSFELLYLRKSPVIHKIRDYVTLEYGTNRIFRNTGTESQVYAA
jgi:hypothetical protein